jgi:hypothetical protein
MLRRLYWEGIHFNKAVVRPQLGWGTTNQARVDDAIERAGRNLPVLDAHLANREYTSIPAIHLLNPGRRTGVCVCSLASIS